MERCSQLKAFFGTGNLYAWKKNLNKGYVVKGKKKVSFLPKPQPSLQSLEPDYCVSLQGFYYKQAQA